MRKPAGYWTIEKAIEESKNYETLAEFKKANQYAHNFLQKNGAIEQCTWLKRRLIYTDETCTEVALNYKTEVEFNREKPCAYQYAKKNGLLEKFDWMEKTIGTKDNPLWTREKISEEIKKYRYKNEFYTHCKGAYSAIKRNGWFDLLESFPNFPNGNIYSGYVYDFPEYNTTYIGITKRFNCATGINDRDEDHHGKGKYCDNPEKSPVYVFAKEHDITDYSPTYIVSDMTAEEAKDFESSEIEKYKSMGRVLLNKAKAGSLGQNGVKWTKEVVFELAKEFVLPGDFFRVHPGAYAAAANNGWIKEFEWMELNKSSKWLIYENCYDEAKKYKSRSEFAYKSSWAYNIAREKKWLDTFDWFERPKRESKYNYDICKELCSECKNRKELEKKHNGCIQWLRKYHREWLDEFLPKTR